MEQTNNDMETARNMNTGMEFGGWNPDSNLNPSQQDQMNNFNDMNNLNDPNMF